MKSVLVITSSIDVTTDYIIKKYQDVAKFYRLNVDKFFEYGFDVNEKSQWSISFIDWTLEKSSIDSIYYRKPMLPDLCEYEDIYQGMIAKDIVSLINGIVDDFEGKVLTKPCVLRKTENKTFQLLYATRKGFQLPRSYIGNNKERVLDYIKNEQSIIKPLTTGKIRKGDQVEIYQTNYINDLQEEIKLTPLYVQSYVEKNYEVRLTCVNKRAFAVRIDSADKLDWRKNYAGLKYSLVECPQNIVDSCFELLRDFGLEFGAFDFIVNKNGEWVFLEVNPNGQWLWLEKEMGLPISKCIIHYLID